MTFGFWIAVFSAGWFARATIDYLNRDEKSIAWTCGVITVVCVALSWLYMAKG